MKKITYIFICGFIGAVFRSLIYKIPFLHQELPYNTLIVNLIGSFGLSLIVFLALREIKMGKELHTGITTGFLGAFTTFSTFSKDIFTMFERGSVTHAFTYVIISITGGLICVFLGFITSDIISNFICKTKEARR